MKCQCRNCYKEYEAEKARGDYRGFCSAKCQHAKAKELGYRKAKNISLKGHRTGTSEYEILNRVGCIGDVPIESERVKLRKELTDLQASRYASTERIALIYRLLNTKLQEG